MVPVLSQHNYRGSANDYSSQIAINTQVQSINQDKLGEDDSTSLEANCRPGIVIEVLYFHHARIDQSSRLREEPFEVGKEWWVVERPFGCALGAR